MGSVESVSLEQARAAWFRAQGLDEPAAADVVGVIERTGWLRTLGGAEAYVAALGRLPGLTSDYVHQAVLRRDLVVTPAVRGCIYLVPASQAGLAMHIAESLDWRATQRDLEKVAVSSEELADVGQAVLEALGDGPLTTNALRRKMPEGVVRSFGDIGKKIGLSSSLPPALRRLEFDGQVQRSLEGGRIDTERYQWQLPQPGESSAGQVPDDPYGVLAALFCRHSGPVSLDDFVAWSGLGKRVARAAIDAAPVISVRVDGYADEAWVHEAVVDTLLSPAPDEVAVAVDKVSLLGFGDNYLGLHGGPAMVTDPAYHDRVVPTWGRGGIQPIVKARHVHMRTVIAGQLLAGLWEYDAETASVVWQAYGELSGADLERVESTASEMAAFLRDDLDSYKTYSLDSDKSIADRVQWIRDM